MDKLRRCDSETLESATFRSVIPPTTIASTGSVPYSARTTYAVDTARRLLRTGQFTADDISKMVPLSVLQITEIANEVGR